MNGAIAHSTLDVTLLNEHILDQPQSIDTADLHPEAMALLANQEVRFFADANSDLVQFRWPWADATYAASIRVALTAYRGDELTPLVNRYYPGYQETILGSEGVIISKRLAAPFKSADDRAAIMTFGCQSEGDSLVRLVVEIDWGEPLIQRMVDGLLVAQRNPRPKQGLYQQSNAESTRVFGNPHGHPEQIELDDESGRASLVYYVLINGDVDVSLLLTVSDVGEQMAWNSFLALRDVERSFELSNNAWRNALKTARLWTPDPIFNQTVHAGKLATLHHLVHLRGGMAPDDLRVERVPALVESLDALDVVQSRNLLAHLRRIAERSNGRLPNLLPIHPKQETADPGRELVRTNGAYLHALSAHLQRHPDQELLAAHYSAVKLCAEEIVKQGWQQGAVPTSAEQVLAAADLRIALSLAMLRRDGVDAVRWESEACELERQVGAHPDAASSSRTWQRENNWRMDPGQPWRFEDPWAGLELAGQVVWRGCGVHWRNGVLHVKPTLPPAWGWWALLDLPLRDGALSLVWDGNTLHATRPLQSDRPVLVHRRIRALYSDELDFNLQFELSDGDEDDRETRFLFHPQFD